MTPEEIEGYFLDFDKTMEAAEAAGERALVAYVPEWGAWFDEGGEG